MKKWNYPENEYNDYIFDGNMLPVAEVRGAGHLTQAEQNANGRLIAGAPEMAEWMESFYLTNRELYLNTRGWRMNESNYTQYIKDGKSFDGSSAMKIEALKILKRMK